VDTASARSFTSSPSSPISVWSGAVDERAFSIATATSFSNATRRRSSSDTCRAMSAVPRERSAICPPRSPRSFVRPVSEFIITSAVSTAVAITEASMPVKPNDR
jgi:hypothetical protein